MITMSNSYCQANIQFAKIMKKKYLQFEIIEVI